MHQGLELELYKWEKNYNVKKVALIEYMLRIKLLSNELEIVCYALTKEHKAMTVLRVLDEQYDSVFSTFIKRIMNE